MMCAQQAMVGHAAFSSAPTPLYDDYHDGGLAEYLRVPHWLIDPLPDTISFDVAAKVPDLANAVRILKSASLPTGSTVVVTAATGTMGTATVKLARHFGVARLILVGRNLDRLRALEDLADGIATDLISIGELPENWATTGGLTAALRHLAPNRAHAVIDFIPEGPATGQAMAALATGGTLAHMGGNATPLPLPPITLMVNCWRFVGIRASTRNDALEVLNLLETGALNADELITQRYPLADAVSAVDTMLRRAAPLWMTVVNP